MLATARLQALQAGTEAYEVMLSTQTVKAAYQAKEREEKHAVLRTSCLESEDPSNSSKDSRTGRPVQAWSLLRVG